MRTDKTSTVWSSFSLCLALLLSSPASRADGDTPNAPATPVQPSSAEVEAALESARADLAELEQKLAEEFSTAQAELAAEQEAVFQLKATQQQVRDELRKLDDELLKLEDQAAEAEDKLERAETDVKAMESELDSQALDVQERTARSLFLAENPDLAPTIDKLTEWDGSQEDRLDELLVLYDRLLDAGASVGQLRTEVRLPAAGGEVREIDVLRVGLLMGYYRNDSETGFLSTSVEDNGFIGEATGLSVEQQAEIAKLIESPAGGGALPFDVTGGSGIATLKSTDSIGRWFEIGGVFMFPLLALAAIVLILSLERGISLCLRSAGLKRRTRRIVALVEDGQLDEAEALAERWGGASGTVFHAALVHRHQGRGVMEDAVQEALLHQAPSFHTRLGFIALAAAVAPLMGLLGTVTGMITTFKMVTLFGTSDPRFMAGGISEALITTQGGLYVAIPALLLRGVLGAVADSAVGKLEAGAMSLVRAVLSVTGSASADTAVSVDDTAQSQDDEPSAEDQIRELEDDLASIDVDEFLADTAQETKPSTGGADPKQRSDEGGSDG